MNKFLGIGNLTKDPAKRTTPNGLSVTTFSIAVKRRFDKEKTEFISIVTWKGLADNCAKYLQKGSKVAVIGEMQTRSYDDKNGVRRYVTEIVCDEVEFLTSKTERNDSPDRGRTEQSAEDLFGDELAAFDPVDESEMPF